MRLPDLAAGTAPATHPRGQPREQSCSTSMHRARKGQREKRALSRTGHSPWAELSHSSPHARVTLLSRPQKGLFKPMLPG